MKQNIDSHCVFYARLTLYENFKVWIKHKQITITWLVRYDLNLSDQCFNKAKLTLNVSVDNSIKKIWQGALVW